MSLLPETGPRLEVPLDALRARVGEVVGVSRWITVGQDMIDAFAAATHDRQPLHVDPAAGAASPFGTTIAHGFLTLSLLAVMAYDALPSVEGRKLGVNYGFEKVRFIGPVPSGARVRGHFTLDEVTERGPDSVMVRVTVTVEVEGSRRPALSAEWLTLVVL